MNRSWKKPITLVRRRSFFNVSCCCLFNIVCPFSLASTPVFAIYFSAAGVLLVNCTAVWRGVCPDISKTSESSKCPNAWLLLITCVAGICGIEIPLCKAIFISPLSLSITATWPNSLCRRLSPGFICMPAIVVPAVILFPSTNRRSTPPPAFGIETTCWGL